MRNAFCIVAHGMVRAMAGSVCDRLKEAREAAGYDTAADAARAFGWKEPTYWAHENGSRGLKFDTLRRYAKAFRTNVNWLLTGEGKPAQDSSVRVAGYVGAAEMVHAIREDADTGDLETVERPPGVKEDNLQALRIKGESMRPLRNGWLVYFNPSGIFDPRDCVGQLCVVQLEDGRRYLKVLRRGYTDGLFNLESWSAGYELIEDVQVQWAGKVLAITP